jgi:hypothetical protein
MKIPARCCTLVLAATLTAAASAQAPTPCATAPVGMFQPGHVISSPAESSFTHLTKTSTTTIYYSAPSIRCRKVFGTLVPFGEVWRTGANPATTLVSQVPLKIGTLSVPAGTHTLYTLPAAPGKPWLLIVNNQTGQWGTVYHEDKDLGRTPLTASELSAPQEALSITFDKKGDATELHIRWDKLDESVPVSAE